MTEIDLCNNALSMIGQGTHISSLTENKKEADACKRLLPVTVARCLDKFNWSFARRDEVITADFLLTDALCLPWKYVYKIPSDVMRLLYAVPMEASSASESIGYHGQIRFNVRNYKDQKVIATDHEAPFIIQYQADISDISIFPPTFCEGVEAALASALAADLIKGIEGVKVSQAMAQIAFQNLEHASALDAQQGAQSIEPVEEDRLVASRHGGFTGYRGWGK